MPIAAAVTSSAGPCDSDASPCNSNGGICTVSNGKASCICKKGYSGDTCSACAAGYSTKGSSNGKKTECGAHCWPQSVPRDAPACRYCMKIPCNAMT
jgi:hypothetical protein